MTDLENSLNENQLLKARLLEAENKILAESIEALAGYVDPREALLGPDGGLWNEVGSLAAPDEAHRSAFADERQLAEARQACRALERTNEFAINGHENRVSYIVGTGHTYTAVARRGSSAGEELVGRVQQVVDRFIRVNRWQQRQQEIVRRRDRDGEVFLRLFVGGDGVTRVRMIEPEQIYRPVELADDPSATFGIRTDPHDVETVLDYWVDGHPVPAGEIQHRKIGVDRNVKRGIPLFYPVRANLLRAEKLLRNMATVADIQTAIAMIRRHSGAARTAAEAFRAEAAKSAFGDTSGSGSPYFRHYAPGTIIDAPQTVQYDFPAAGLDASRYVEVLQAVLRSVAARLLFPEFMLTSDASNANYSSTLVAEGPAVKMFERWQADLRIDDLEVMWRVVDNAVRAGLLPAETSASVEIHVGLPRVATRDAKQEAEVNKIYHQLGVKSRQTIAAELGLDYEQEQENAARDNEMKSLDERASL